MGVRVFNATFNTISVVSWQPFYLWRKPQYTETQTCAFCNPPINLLNRIHLAMSGIRTHYFLTKWCHPTSLTLVKLYVNSPTVTVPTFHQVIVSKNNCLSTNIIKQ